MKRGTRSIPLLSICLLLQGCVGIEVDKTRSQVYQNPHISNYASSRGLEYSGEYKTNSFACTPAWLEQHWGKPASITHDKPESQSETWTYKFGPIFNGVTPFVLIPIPIILPVGREQVQFVLKDGHVVSAKTHREQSVGCAYGVSPGPCATFGPSSWND